MWNSAGEEQWPFSPVGLFSRYPTWIRAWSSFLKDFPAFTALQDSDPSVDSEAPSSYVAAIVDTVAMATRVEPSSSTRFLHSTVREGGEERRLTLRIRRSTGSWWCP